MTTTIIWRDAKNKLPKKSGTYLIVNRANYVMTVDYSAVHKLFNCYDYDTKQEALQTSFLPKYWAKLPNFDEVLKNG